MVNIWLLYVIIWLMIVNNNLVGGFCDSFNHLEKYEFVNGKDDIPYVYIYIYMKWKIKFMFETTNQFCFLDFIRDLIGDKIAHQFP